MGHLDGIWDSDLGKHLEVAVLRLRAEPASDSDQRMARGRERGGRTSALAVAERIRDHE